MLKVRTVRCISLSQMRLLMICAGDAAGFSLLREFSLFVRVLFTMWVTVAPGLITC